MLIYSFNFYFDILRNLAFYIKYMGILQRVHSVNLIKTDPR